MADSNPKRVLITLAGGNLGLPVSEALRAAPEDIYLIGTDSSQYHVHLAEADEVHVIPRANEPDFINVLAKVARESKADFIWPQHDAEIEVVSKYADQLPAKTWLPPHDVVASTADKRKTYELLKAAGVPTPETIDLFKRDDLVTAFKEFDGQVWLRSATGGGGAGALKASDISHAEAWVDMHDGWGNFTASEVLPGPGDYVWDSVWDRGQLIVAQRQTRVVRGITGLSLAGVTSRGVLACDGPDGVEEFGIAAIKALAPKPHGVFRVDFMTGANGVPSVTEIDAGRFTSGDAVIWFNQGVNLPHTVLKIAFGEPIDFETPLLDPYPKDIVAINAISRAPVFIKRTEIDHHVQALSHRREG